MGTAKRLKITVVGDGMVGKTCLLYVYTRNEFPEEYVPTVQSDQFQKLPKKKGNETSDSTPVTDEIATLEAEFEGEIKDNCFGKKIFPKEIQRTFTRSYVGEVPKYRFDNYVGHITVDGEEVEMALWDTAGQEDYERLRPLSYNNTNCFLVCYSIGSRSSYDNVSLKWYPELKHFSSAVPIVLVATKADLRATGKAVITTQEGKKLKRKIRAAQLVECSALERLNMTEVFEEAVRAALRMKPVHKRTCQYL